MFSHVYSPVCLNNTLLSQGHVLEYGSHGGNGRHPKDRGGVEEPPSAWV